MVGYPQVDTETIWVYSQGMKEETWLGRVYKTDYKNIMKEAKEGDTTFARIVHEMWEETHPDLEHD